MLKRMFSLVLVLPIVLTIAYAPPAHAASAQVVVAQVQAGGDGAATQEFVSIYNNSNDAVDITGWCLTNKSSVSFVCFSSSLPQRALYLPAYSYAWVASQSFVDAKFLSPTQVYTPSHASNGSIVGGSDTISLLDRNGVLVDRVSWTTSIPGDYVMQRHVQSLIPFVLFDTGNSSDWFVEMRTYLPNNEVEYRDQIFDACLNIEGSQLQLPEGYLLDVDGQCVYDVCPNVSGLQVTLPDLMRISDQSCVRYYLPIIVTEMLPNAIGSDEGNEFIEIYNPNDQPVNLAEYTLFVGVDSPKSLALPGITIEPFQYASLSNHEFNFTLVNTVGRVSLTSVDGSFLEAPPAYDSPKEGESWVVIDGVWQYTNQPTPGTANLASVPKGEVMEEDIADGTSGGAVSLKPCAANQERNPETNRCRLIASAATSSALTPCKEGQERNPETNRCRSIATTETSPAPCKEGQERNPETNRCRNIVSMPEADYKVLGAETSNDSNWWYIVWAVGALVVLAGAYATWEWRRELAKLFVRVSGLVRVRK